MFESVIPLGPMGWSKDIYIWCSQVKWIPYLFYRGMQEKLQLTAAARKPSSCLELAILPTSSNLTQYTSIYRRTNVKKIEISSGTNQLWYQSMTKTLNIPRINWASLQRLKSYDSSKVICNTVCVSTCYSLEVHGFCLLGNWSICFALQTLQTLYNAAVIKELFNEYW